jgi:hypothetical protein
METMKLPRRGMATSRKVALTVGIALLVALGAYIAIGPGRLSIVPNESGSTSYHSSTATAPLNGVGQPNNILGLFGNFSKMVVSIHFVVMADGEINSEGGTHASYAVLGRTVVNSTNYYKVEFTDLDANKSIIAWFDQQGTINRVDVLGDRNYTGSTASMHAQIFTSTFSFLPSVSYNATLLSGLQRTGESAQGIGPTQMDVTTYNLAAKTAAFSNLTVKIGTVPGTSTKLAVFLYQESPDSSSSLFQVTSVTRA